MIVRLKTKLLAGFMLLASLLIVAGTISVLEFIKLSSSFSSLLNNNYKSIEASKRMLEALEREDSGILLLLLGEWEKGRSILEEADSSFQSSFETAKNNITEDNEQQLISAIHEQYNAYKARWINPIVYTRKQGDISWYHNSLHKEFLEIKLVINELMSINQNSLYNKTSTLQINAQRAVMPGIIAILGAVVFLVMLNFYIRKQFVEPLKQIKTAVKKHAKGDSMISSGINSKDEFKELEVEINQMLHRIQKPDEKN